jgi:hypothetical protein
MEFEQAVQQIIRLAVEHRGTVTAAQIESDDELEIGRETTSAAGHMLAGSTNVLTFGGSEGRDWFPYSGLLFTEIRQKYE